MLTTTLIRDPECLYVIFNFKFRDVSGINRDVACSSAPSTRNKILARRFA